MTSPDSALDSTSALVLPSSNATMSPPLGPAFAFEQDWTQSIAIASPAAASMAVHLFVNPFRSVATETASGE